MAVRAAELSRLRRMPLHFRIISSLQAGGNIWTDPRDKTFLIGISNCCRMITSRSISPCRTKWLSRLYVVQSF